MEENTNNQQQQQEQAQQQNTQQEKINNNKEPEKKYSDADIDKIVEAKFAKWQEKKSKEIDEAKKLGEMTAQQKAEFERDKLDKELKELKRANTLNEMSKGVRKIFNDENINISDDILAVLVTDDAEKTKTAVDGFISLFKKSVENAVKEQLKGNPPKSGKNSTLTKADIMAIKDREARQKAISENITLFE